MFDTGMTTLSGLDGLGIFMLFRLCELPLICILGLLMEEAMEWLGDTWALARLDFSARSGLIKGRFASASREEDPRRSFSNLRAFCLSNAKES